MINQAYDRLECRVRNGNELVKRILDLIPENPHILGLNSPWGLFKIPGFKCSDLGATAAQASFALRKAKVEYVQKQNKLNQQAGG